MYKIKLFITILLLFAVFNFNATAQNAGDNDPTFNPYDVGFGYGPGANNTIESSTILSNGKIIIGGYFTAYNDTVRNYITQLNNDGSLDGTFNIGTGANSWVKTTAVQSDGKIIIGGDFTTFNGVTKNRIVRLNTDGSIDATFNIGTGLTGYLSAIAIQTDGKIILGGNFTSYNGVAKNRIVRLNTNGSIDATFNIGSGANDFVTTIAIQTDGKIILGGNFTTYNGLVSSRIVRLNIDGSHDTTFNVGTGADKFISSIKIQPDGKIIAGGDFDSYNGVVRYKIARINSDGSLDGSLSSNLDQEILSLLIQPDGKIVIGGVFTICNFSTRNRIARLNSDGSLDTSFNPYGVNDAISSVSMQSDGKIIIAGGFVNFNTFMVRRRIARLNTDGSIDVSLNPGTGADQYVSSSAIQPDDKIIIGGYFSIYDGVNNRLPRLNINGDIDTTFNVGTGPNNITNSISLLNDSTVIISGSFLSFNGILCNRLAKLGVDGSLDVSFNTGTGVGGSSPNLWGVKEQPDGKIIIVGSFSSFNGVGKNNLVRLNDDGSIDNSFNIGIGANDVIYSCAIQSDGKIIIGGAFTSYNGMGMNRIARINTDGSLDSSFDVGLGVNDLIRVINIQNDGKIIIGGHFTSYNGTAINRISRLNTDGSLDTSFNVGSGANNPILTSMIQNNGKVIIGGAFTNYNGISRNYITRLNSDGTLDNTFSSGVGANNSVYTISKQSDGKIIIGGFFTSYNGVGRNRIARLLNCDVKANYSNIDNGNGNYSFSNTSLGGFNQTHWAFGDGTTSTAANPNHTFSANGTYVVVLTVNDSTNSTCTDYYLDTIVVTGVVAPLQCAAGFVMYPDAGNVTVVNSSTGSNLTYLWDFGDGNTSNAQFPTHTYATTDNYYLCLTIDNGAGCVDMYCDSIGQNGVVFNKQTGFTINVIAPPLVTQINEQISINNGLTIYPNPSSAIFTIEHSKENIPFIITDISGRVITISKLTGNKTNIDLSKVQKGVYLLKIGGQTMKLIRQ